MSADKDMVSSMVLKAMLAAAVVQGMDVTVLCEVAIELILNDKTCGADDAAKAVIEIEAAVDALTWGSERSAEI